MSGRTKKVLSAAARYFLYLWIATILIFFLLLVFGGEKAHAGGPWNDILLLDFGLGIFSFLMMFIFAILGALFNPKERKVGLQKPKKTASLNTRWAGIILGIFILLAGTVIVRNNQKSQIQTQRSNNYPSKATVSTPTASPLVEGTSTQMETTNPDPIITCNIHLNCGGGTRQMKKSECEQSICCQIGSNWYFYLSKDKCTQDQKAEQQKQEPQKPRQPTTNLSYHCYDNTYDYWYYTSSGEKCNINNLESSAYETCKEIQKTKANSCDYSCETQKDEDNNICAWAYTGQDAGVEQNPDLYSECLSEVTDEYGDCLDSCTNQYLTDLEECN